MGSLERTAQLHWAGTATAGTWYTIPDNTQWHTVTWQIDAPQFVGYWGYNFSLVSDGNEYNNYYLRRVTVTKLQPEVLRQAASRYGSKATRQL